MKTELPPWRDVLHFADRIVEVCLEKKSRLVVGLDPHRDLLPESVRCDDSAALASGLAAFLAGIVDATVAHAVAFKPQLAFFEQFGLAGMTALDRVLRHIRDRGGLIIMDGKRNDIGSTARAYARAYFGGGGFPPAFDSDALTINAYLGTDGVAPFLEDPAKGVFILVKTSNPSSGEFQDLVLERERETLAERMAHSVDIWNRASLGQSGYGNVGAVVGATYPKHIEALRRLMPRSLILVPGYGAQGGDERALRAAFNRDGLGALINSSRAICFPAEFKTRGFAAVGETAEQTKDHINTVLAHSLKS